MTTNYAKTFGKIKPLVMLGMINVLIVCVVIYVYSVHREKENVGSILPSDWSVLTESRFFSHGTFGHEVKLQSKKSCTIPAHTEKGGITQAQKRLFPNITIRFDSPWSAEDIKKAEAIYKKCQESLQIRPMIAISCEKTTPTFITSTHAVFIETEDCTGESVAIVKKIEAYYSSDQ